MKLGVYQHYKGRYYQVIGLAKHTETKQNLVVYCLYQSSDDQLWARPKEMFEGLVEINGKKIHRFQFIKENIEK